MNRQTATGLIVCLALAGCASAPTGPTVMVLPGTGRSFDDFRADETVCRQYAVEQTGGASAQQRAQQSSVSSAAVGTVVGAAAGAAIGGQQGAGIGAGTGLLFGSVVGADSTQQSAYGTQRQYDNAYIQCMYAKGHRVPVPSGMITNGPASGPPPPPPLPAAPPSVPRPPAGTPPPPPR